MTISEFEYRGFRAVEFEHELIEYKVLENAIVIHHLFTYGYPADIISTVIVPYDGKSLAKVTEVRLKSMSNKPSSLRYYEVIIDTPFEELKERIKEMSSYELRRFVNEIYKKEKVKEYVKVY